MYRVDMLYRVIEMAVLGLLQDQELHGYELRKRLTSLVGLRGAISFGSLYPALARLEAVGAVKVVEAASSRVIPMTGSLSGEASAFLARRRGAAGRGGRARKVYGITDQGRQLLLTLLEDSHTDERSFPLKVALCGALPPDQRLELFERRRAAVATQLAETHRSPRRAEGVDRYLRALREHDLQTMENEISWLDGLIALEREHRAGGPDTKEEPSL
jgi:DNA-binding PadR family transcriptional regulator